VNNYTDWLRIKLDCGKGWLPGTVVFAITFRNESDGVRALPFSNTAGKAEFLGLSILDKSGIRLMPDNAIIGRYVKNSKPRHICSRGIWTYKLRGRIRGHVLSFSKTRFTLMPGMAYKVGFSYLGVSSQHVDWTP